METARKIILLFLLFFAVYLLISILRIGFNTGMSAWIETSDQWEFFIRILLGSVSFVLVSCMVIKLSNAYHFSDFGFRINKIIISLSVKIFFVCVAVLGFCIFISNQIGLFGYSKTGIGLFPVHTLLVTVFVCNLVGSLLIAMGEETFMRGFVLHKINQVFSNNLFAILLSASLFSAMHIGSYADLLSFINAFLGGILLGYLTVKTGSIVPAIAVHFAWDFMHFSFFSLQDDIFEHPQLFYSSNFKHTSIGPYTEFVLTIGIIGIFLIIRKMFFKKLNIIESNLKPSLKSSLL